VRAVPRAAGSPSSAGASGAPASPLPLPVPKSKLKPEELDAFKRLLLEKRVELLEDVGNMEAEALKKNRSDAAGDLSMMPIHMADIGTDAYEQEFTIGLIENEQEIVKEIDAALERMTNGAYGICEATGKRIKKARLKAKPWARYCVAYKRSREETGR
jgi:RNA polymerase-binding protein DksA